MAVAKKLRVRVEDIKKVPKGKNKPLARTPIKRIVRTRKKVVPHTRPKVIDLRKSKLNPIMRPNPNVSWEAAAVFNPAAIVHENKVHLFYRAMGHDGISRIGYARSDDGLNFDTRFPYPVFVAESVEEATARVPHSPYTSPARMSYNTDLNPSGGGWGGCEDPRAVNIEGRIYLTFTMFNGWEAMRIAYTSITQNELTRGDWNWARPKYLTRDRQKNWVLFPEKINGRFAVFHNLDMGDPTRVHIAYVDSLDASLMPTGKDAPDPQRLPDHIVSWHHRTRSASAPPIRTSEGWLLFYHAMDKDDPDRYKVGAMLLDLDDPTRVMYRAAYPILEPDEWYENDWKPGIVFASGAVVKEGMLYLYYGGGDKHIAVAHAPLATFLKQLKSKEHIALSSKPMVKVPV